MIFPADNIKSGGPIKTKKAAVFKTFAKNTVLYHFAFILIDNSLQVLAAVLLNGIGQKWFKKSSQAIMLLPHFISFVLIGLFAYNMLSYDYGLVNNFLKNVAMEPIKTYSNPSIWTAILVLTHLWKATEYGSIIINQRLKTNDALKFLAFV